MASVREEIEVRPAEVLKRIDAFLAERTGRTRSHVQRLIRTGSVLVNGKAVGASYRVRAADSIVVMEETGAQPDGLVPEPLPLEVLYRDDHLVVVNKPPGMVVYPAAGHSRGTLMNALAYHCGRLASVGAPLRPGVVHRLDRDTSGVMVVALDDAAYYNLVDQFRARTIRRKYVALISGNPGTDAGEIALPIGRSVSDRKKMSTRTRRGKEAVTRWSMLRRFGNAALVEARLGTGRTHQIRVHFASVGHAVLGDRTYGKKTETDVRGRKVPVPRQMLHAETLGFTHPVSGEYLEFSTPLPEDMLETIKSLEDASGK